jgi:hypothetical protein
MGKYRPVKTVDVTMPATELVQRNLVVRAEGRQHVAEVDRVFGISIEVRARRQPRRGNRADYCAVAQDRQVEGSPVECNQLRVEIGDSVDDAEIISFSERSPIFGAPTAETAQCSSCRCATRAPMQTIE